MVTEVVSRVATTIESSKHQESTKGPVLDPTGVFLVLTVAIQPSATADKKLCRASQASGIEGTEVGCHSGWDQARIDDPASSFSIVHDRMLIGSLQNGDNWNPEDSVSGR